MTRLLFRLAHSRSALLGGIALLLIACAVVFADQLSSADPFAMVAQPFVPPGTDAAYPLGTDMLGRDILSGLLHGGRVSLLVGFSAAAIALLLGLSIGICAGYFGGVADLVLSRATEAFQTVPHLIFVIVTTAVLGPSLLSIVAGIGASAWPKLARLARAEALRLRHADFVLASRAMGMGHPRVLLMHVLPNTLAPLVSSATIVVATAILAEAALSFLGLGDRNVISWGSMIGAGREVLRTAWYIAAIPGVAISLATLSVIYFGQGLNDALNPRVAT